MPSGPGVGRHGEAEAVAVEGERAIEVRHPQVDVSDPDRRVDGLVLHERSLPARAIGAIGGSTYPAHERMRAMVGRAAERAVLESLVGSSGAVVVTGEPGIGKSRLLAFLAERAAAAGCAVVAGRATEYEDDLPFGPWRDALEPHLEELGERRVSLLGLEDPEALAAILPGLAPAPAAVDRHRGHRALRDLLERLAAARPLVVCLDDLHWADPATIDALAALVRRPPAAPVLLALAAREGLVPRALAGARMVAVGPLSEAEAVELIGQAAPGVYAASGGNPFFLEQLARAPEGPVPATVAVALEAELGRLSAPARRLLDAAAVAGDPFEPAMTRQRHGLSSSTHTHHQTSPPQHLL